MKLAPALLLSALALCACGPKTPPPQAAAADAPLATDVVAVKSLVLSTKTALPAQLLPYESVDLYPKVAGFIQEIRVDRGSKVKQGELLVRLTAPEVVAQQGQAQAALSGAEAKLASDRATYERLANAAKTPGVVAENDVNISKQATASDAAQVKAASESAAAARQLGAYLEIRAPFDGVITARNLHPGALVGPQGGAGAQPILQMVTPHRLRLVVSVPEASVQSARPGQSMSFTVPTLPGQTFNAPIVRMADALDNRTRTMSVEADVANPKGELTPGAFATVLWPVTRSYPTLRVPSSAVANDQQRQFVIKVANGVAAWVDVATGMSDGGALEVFGALQPGDYVVKRGTDAVKPGAKIKPTIAK
ncbi:efflux RND transporter periplasmic adaptor subunit [Phenylobacterium sp.]|jgi:RND family efflux transporter MFP subunit|uniref:efflux RND transporter periplasmic adaptor subunit n=1 Tax=Phenylobacterium sp. TaxID=1871053 RepID=UPI002E32C42D|nr:efflux RND transporter periplasmic adaptor subunit [Phenylobacterium sp.]HEX3366097.1 efflux RND transporter periplasmic adaptor subunit [Phenylobacterium sp.]